MLLRNKKLHAGKKDKLNAGGKRKNLNVHYDIYKVRHNINNLELRSARQCFLSDIMSQKAACSDSSPWQRNSEISTFSVIYSLTVILHFSTTVLKHLVIFGGQELITYACIQSKQKQERPHSGSSVGMWKYIHLRFEMIAHAAGGFICKG